MNFLKNWFQSAKKDEPQKKKVCWLVLGKMLGYMLVMTDEEQEKLGQINDHDPKVLQEIIHEYVVPHYRYFPLDIQEKLKKCLAYYLSADNEKLE